MRHDDSLSNTAPGGAKVGNGRAGYGLLRVMMAGIGGQRMRTTAGKGNPALAAVDIPSRNGL